VVMQGTSLMNVAMFADALTTCIGTFEVRRQSQASS